ncbi:hypothetical protein [Halocola ammonii]
MKNFSFILASAIFVLGCTSTINSDQLAEKKEIESITYRIQKDDLMKEFGAYYDSEYSKKNHEVVICNVNDEEYEITFTEFEKED